MKYRKKPVVVEAVRWTGENVEETNNLCGNYAKLATSHLGNTVFYRLGIETLEGFMQAPTGDYYPCKPDVFAKTYEAVEE